MTFRARGRLTDVSRAEAARSRPDDAALVDAALAGDRSAFGEVVERYRRELQVHCYRMLGSFEDAEDVVQETLLRAWRKRKSFGGRSTFRAWLYGIATNACLDALKRRPRPAPSEQANPADMPWLQPYPDRLLEGIAPRDEEPDAVVVEKETIELAFLVSIQQLPPRQRAVLILRDVLGWSAKETAYLLQGSVAAVNSALQRARGAMREHLPERRSEWAPGSDPSSEERALVERYIEANDRGDTAALVELLGEEARFTMPPEPTVVVGGEAIVSFWVEGGFGSEAFGELRCLPTRANMQPAVACYVRRPGDTAFRALAIDVLRIEDGLIAEISTFVYPELFPAFVPRDEFPAGSRLTS
jgi:RNA polymerase sigma-70 factor, ECF subfamily